MAYFIIVDNNTIMINQEKNTEATTKSKLMNEFKKLFEEE
jgi:hypothetical protein